MKISTSTHPFGITVLTAAAFAFSTLHSPADTNYVSRFDSASEVDSWGFDFGSVTHTNTFDPAMDGNMNAASGAMKVTFGFSPALGGESKGAYTIPLSAPIVGDAVLDLDTIHLDLKVDPASAMDAYGLNG